MRSALGLVLVGLVACGSDGISIEDAPDAFLDEACNYLARCHLVTNHAACLELNLGLELRIDASLAAAIEAGKVKYDGTKLAQCYATFGDRSCDRTTEDGRGLGLNGDACDGAITGTVADGGACAIDEECLSRSCTVPTCPDACCQGTCDPSVASTGPAPLGGACETTSDCASGGYCATGVCTALLAAGATCAGTTECAYGLGCAGTPRTCKQLPTVGQACPDGQCRDAGTYCDQSMVCKAPGFL